ncbi:hypothetical protein ALC57_10376 [Trachymyrmex cornetzi]|uniref:Uncharacterized protein n=1 Tax=Trachymyrmex cornetzi TaxID=471704 RepID=A0A195DXQ5_9HYME|nr:hypothetical protein ALC57_10376 [Trachymyrmex cornetzi]
MTETNMKIFFNVIKLKVPSRNGRRTIDCCSHIAAIIYYLSYARYVSKIFKPSEILSDIFKEDNSIPVTESDNDVD